MGENARKRKAGDDDEDEDAEAGDDEPVLEGEDDDGFKELESDGEEDADGDFDEEGFGGADSDDFDEEGFGEEEEEDDKMSTPSPIAKKGKQKKAKFPKFDPNNLDSILADAEQFSHLIEENDDDAGLTSSVSNSDKAGKKQLAWERKREGGGGGYKGKKGIKGAKGGQKSKGGNIKPMSFKSKSLAKKRKKS